MKVYRDMEDPYEALANAIILQAVEDYRQALKRVKKDPHNGAAMHNALSIERFFRGSWFGTLTKIDPENLIKKLRQEAAA